MPFVEWMQMLPHGWVTRVEHRRTFGLRMLGNCVVPPQAVLALKELMNR